MACNDHYVPQSRRNIETRRAAWLLKYLMEKRDVRVPQNVKHATGRYPYPDYPTFIPKLCAMMRGLSKRELELYIFKPKNMYAKDLVIWWDEHCKADARRMKKELFLS